MANVTLMGASYTDVPAVTLPKTGGGTARFTDVSDSTAAASDVNSGKYIYLADGSRVQGSQTVHTVSETLTHITSTNQATKIISGDSFHAVLSPDSGYRIESITVTMGGVDITDQAFTPGTGAKAITANGTYDASDDLLSGYSQVTVNVPSGGSATEHEIYLEFSDSTDTTIPVYYDDAFIGTIITASAPTTYGGKTVDAASLDGVEWYRATGYTTLYEGTPAFYTDATPYYLWIPELANAHPVLGSVWRITIDGTAYICTAKNSLAGVIVGNPVHVGGADDGSGVPVAFYNYNSQAWSGDTTTLSAGTYTVKIERQISA